MQGRLNMRPGRLLRGSAHAGFWAAVLVPALLATQGAEAITTPIEGGVSLPVDFEIRLPFLAGENVYIFAGYSPSGGSSLHATTDDPSHANDYYALDFNLPDYPSDGLGQPVLAVASGTVLLAGWATSGWSNYGLRVIILHDYNADGHRYVTIYCHLNDVYVSEEDSVVMGTELGELGDSCNGDLSCPHFGTHLHFAMHRDSTVGGSGSGGSYGGNAVVPEPFDGYEDLVRGMTLVSHNDGGGPLPTCDPLAPEGGILDERGPCFVKGGTPTYWHHESAGWDGHLIWTTATSDSSPDDWGRWNIILSTPGRYLLEAYTDGGFAQSRRALYDIRHGETTDSVRVDQTAVDGWNPIGSFDFAASGEQFVRLNDNTGEPVSENIQLVFDAIRVTPGSGPEPDDDAYTEPDAEPDVASDAGMDAMTEDVADAMAEDRVNADVDDVTDPDVDDVAGPDVDVDAGGDAEADLSLPPPVEVGSGCACTISPQGPVSSAGFMWMIAVVLVALARRRSR